MRFADKVKGNIGQNPFGDSQSRNYSDQKVSSEFFPMSMFWSLFNDQHEVVLGSRGSGKTFLLKMMRYSMLKKIDDDRARKLVKDKNYIALYVPMHLEIVIPFNNDKIDETDRIAIFQVAFNCYLCEALLIELESLVEEIEDKKQRLITQIALVENLERLWFQTTTDICEFSDLSDRIMDIYYDIDLKAPVLENIPNIFKREICSPLVKAKKKIAELLEFDDEPTWIVCVDEAEFCNETIQRCINDRFRSDSKRIALKVATLPFYHLTLKTLVDGIEVSDIDDFKYTIVDLKYDESDFKDLTNSLCRSRLKDRFDSSDLCESLEAFVGIEGNDDYRDYYRLEVGEDLATTEAIKAGIIDSFSEVRKENATNYANDRKTIFDKFAPVFYVREMKKLSGIGNHKPGWYAGAKMIRRVSQGNPRLFLRLMNELFEKARETELTAKAQHEVLCEFADRICNSTWALPDNGPKASKNLDNISEKLSDKVHKGDLTQGGNSFTIQYSKIAPFEKEKQWIELAIAHSRIIVDNETIRTGIRENTKYAVSNAYAVKYWIPMRSETPLKIKLEEKTDNNYEVKAFKSRIGAEKENYYQYQLPFVEEEVETNND